MRGALRSLAVGQVMPDNGLQQWRIWYRFIPPSGDGVTAPLDLGGVEFEGVTQMDGVAAPAEVWDWAVPTFDALRSVIADAARRTAVDLNRAGVP